MELISEGLTDVDNRLQESAAGSLRTEYPGGNWKEMVGSGAGRKSMVCRKDLRDIRRETSAETGQPLPKPRHLHASVFSLR